MASDRSTERIIDLLYGELTPEEETQLRRMAKSIVLKGVQSPERLLDETALFLHRVIADLPVSKQRMLESLNQSDEALVGKRVLVVDDDVRNIFALTSLLERHQMQTASAGSGGEARRVALGFEHDHQRGRPGAGSAVREVHLRFGAAVEGVLVHVADHADHPEWRAAEDPDGAAQRVLARPEQLGERAVDEPDQLGVR